MPFIVLEGLDGSGKTTQLNLLTRFLDVQGKGYEFIHFPRFDAPFYGELISRFLRGEFGAADKVDPYLVALLFAGDRADAAPSIGRWLSEGKCVVADRYVYSNIAFQCAKYDDEADRERLQEWILNLEFGYNHLPRPDISIFLDVPMPFIREKLSDAREGTDREYLKGGKDIHEESFELQRRVREIYREISCSEDGLSIVDCSDGSGNIDTPENNFDKIVSLIEPLL